MLKRLVLITSLCILIAVCVIIAQGQQLANLMHEAEGGDTGTALELAKAYHEGQRIAGRRTVQNSVLAIKYAALAGGPGLSILAHYTDSEAEHIPEDILSDRRLRMISTALAKYTKDPISRYLLGAAYYWHVPEKTHDGLRLLKEGVELGGTQCMLVYAQILCEQGDFNQAIKLLKKVPHSPEQKFNLGYVYLKQSNASRGLKLIEQAALQGYKPAQNFLDEASRIKAGKEAAAETCLPVTQLKKSSTGKQSDNKAITVNGPHHTSSAYNPSPSATSSLTFNVAPTGVGNTSNITLNVSPNMFPDTVNSKTYQRIDMDVLLEVKAAYFLSTDTAFKNVYGKGGPMYGVEITFKLHKQLFGWLSADFFTKTGTSLRNGISSCAGISTCCQVLTRNCSPTKLTVIPLAIGLKYFIPFATARKSLMGDLYLGLGIEPTYLSSCMLGCTKTTTVGLGGIAKVGVYFELPQNFFIDLFANYSFVGTDDNKRFIPNPSGFIFGAGIGYRFN